MRLELYDDERLKSMCAADFLDISKRNDPGAEKLALSFLKEVLHAASQGRTSCRVARFYDNRQTERAAQRLLENAGFLVVMRVDSDFIKICWDGAL